MHKKRYLYLSMLVLLFICSNANAQNYNFNVKRFTIEDGLSQRAVRCIIQDHKGFIWIGTELGLNRFDGYSFKYWTKADNGLLNNEIHSIYEDSENKLWLFNIKENISSIEIFDPVTEKGVPFKTKFQGKLPNPEIELTNNYVTDNTGSIYFGTLYPSGILKYNPKTGFEHILIKEGLTFNPEVFTGNNTIWGKLFITGVESHHGDLVEINLQGKILNNLGKAFIKQPVYHSFSENGSFYYEKQLTLNSPIETWQHDGQNKEIHLSKFDSNRHVYQASPLWLYLKDNKLLAHESIIEDTKTGKVVLDLKNYIPELKQQGVQSWMLDRSGLLWVGCAFGLCIIDIQENQFKNFMFNGDNQSLGIAIRGILPLADGTIKVNTERAGQWNIDKSTGKAVQFSPSSPVYYYGLGIDNNKNLYYSNTRDVIEKLTQSQLKKKFSWSGGLIWCYYFDERQYLWMGTAEHGLAIFDVSNEKIRFFTSYNGYDELSHTSIYYINKDKSGKLWVCAETGLYQIDPVRGVMGRYWSGGKDKFYLPHDYFLHFLIDADDVFWLATSGGGLIKWDKAKGESIRYGRKSGLPVETIYAVYEDKHQHLWIPSEFGIVQFDKKKGEVRRIYNTSSGISHQEFNRIAHARDPEDNLYFGGLNGITSFNPNLFYGQENLQNAPLVISDCQKLESNLGILVNITKEVLKTSCIELGANDTYFSLDLALLTFNETFKIQYAYKFEDEKNWHFQSDRTLRFGSLSYGRKKLHIKAQAANGVWAANELILDVNQLAPFYFRWWFILLIIILVYGFVKWRLWRLKKRQKQLEIEINKATLHIEKQAEELRHIDEVKSKFFANVSHELRTPLTLIIGPIGTLLKRRTENDQDHRLLKLAQQQSKGLLSLINQILDLSKLEASKLELFESKVKLQSFLLRVYGSFETHADRLGINYYLIFHPDPNLIVLLDINKFEIILNNLISNALKFTAFGDNLIIEVKEIQETIFISVTDTGSGIHQDDLEHIFERYYQSNQLNIATAGGTGIGLALCKEFVELMKGKIWVESDLGKGSKFFIKIPKKQVGDISESNPDLRTDEETFKENLGLDKNISVSENEKTNLPTILVVEDNISLGEYLHLILSSSYNVIVKENGELALKWLELNAQNNCPELIISDIMMPVMDGFQLLSTIKNDSRFMDIPVIMLTAKAEVNDKLKALRIGVDDYLLKPFNEEELLVRIKNLLSNFQSRKLYTDKLSIDNKLTDVFETNNVTESKIHHEHKIWLQMLENYIQEHLSDQMITTDQIAYNFSMSRSAFYRQVKRLTGLAPSQYLDEARFYKARQLLESRPGIQVKEVAFMVGFIKVKYFSKRFYQRFGKYPSEYLEQ